jgi:predicted permease
VRGILVEGLVLATAGGALGVVVGIWGARALVPTMIAGSTRTALDLSIDGQLIAAAVITSLMAALLFSAAPALRTARGRISPVLKQVAAGANTPRFNAGRILMVVQVAISLPLLVGAALFLRTIHNLAEVDLGFNPARLLLFRVDPALNGYDMMRVERLYGQLLQRLDAIPGVESATLTDIVLLSRLQNNWTFLVPGSEPKNVKFARVGPAYFETFGIPTVTGRTIGVQDHSRAPRVAVVNEAAARALFGDGPAVGRTLTMQSDQPAVFQIVGIVKDSRYTSPRDSMPPTVYLPYAQTTLGRLGPMTVAIRSALPPSGLSEAVRAAMADVDRDVPIMDPKTQLAQLNETLSTERTFMRLLVAFGAFALILASIGLYGVTAYSVVRRTSEIGVRVALGARQIDVLRLILRQVLGITLVGVAIGVPAAIAAAQLVRASLFGVGPADPISVVGAALVMVVVAMSAGFFPARRAARLDPLVALHCE